MKTPVKEFLDEVDEVFGFFYGVSLACHAGLKEIERVQRATNSNDDSEFHFSDEKPKGPPDEVFAKSLHWTSIRDLKEALGKDGRRTQQAGAAAIVFIYALWERKYRKRLSAKDGSLPDSDVMGDMRLWRNSIIHNRGIGVPELKRCRVLKQFGSGDRLVIADPIIAAVVRAIDEEFRRLDPTADRKKKK